MENKLHITAEYETIFDGPANAMNDYDTVEITGDLCWDNDYKFNGNLIVNGNLTFSYSSLVLDFKSLCVTGDILFAGLNSSMYQTKNRKQAELRLKTGELRTGSLTVVDTSDMILDCPSITAKSLTFKNVANTCFVVQPKLDVQTMTFDNSGIGLSNKSDVNSGDMNSNDTVSSNMNSNNMNSGDIDLGTTSLFS